MMVRPTSFSTMRWPIIVGSDPYFRFHNPSVIITVGLAPSRSSSAEKLRPKRGFIPRISKKPAEIISPCRCSGSPCPERLNPVERYAAMELKLRFIRRQSSKFGYEIDPFLKFGISVNKETICSGCGYGSGLSNTPFTTEKIAVFAPIPSARVKMAIRAKPGDLASMRAP